MKINKYILEIISVITFIIFITTSIVWSASILYLRPLVARERNDRGQRTTRRDFLKMAGATVVGGAAPALGSLASQSTMQRIVSPSERMDLIVTQEIKHNTEKTKPG